MNIEQAQRENLYTKNSKKAIMARIEKSLNLDLQQQLSTFDRS